MPLSSSSSNNQHTLILRLLFVASLLIAAAICGIVSFVVVDNLERSVGLQTYESIAKSLLENAKQITRRKVMGGEVMASIMGHAFPDSSQWPFVALEGYVETANKLAALTGSLTLAVNPFVLPEQVEEFNKHANQTYQEGLVGDYPPETGCFNETTTEEEGEGGVQCGIWKRDKDRNRLLDTTGETSWNSTNFDNILLPVFMHNNVNAGSILFNAHSPYFLGTALDSMLDCAATEAATTTNGEESSSSSSCVVVTDFFELIVQPGPAALLYVPIYSKHDSAIVAVAASSVNWAEVLTHVVPDYVDGLDCVISTDTNSYTYVINKGIPHLRGEGDLHNTAYEDKAHSVVLNDFIVTGANGNKQYTLTVYPTDQMLDEFRTQAPIVIAIGFVAVILLCAIIFACYDMLIRGENRQQKAILEVKRKFVRFVSHEIRTPLNTCCLGLELVLAELESELKGTQQTQQQQTPTPNNNNTQQFLQSLMDLTSDILDNSESAVTILNDLLNYDKIETGTFQLEVNVVPIWELIRKTVSAFDIQARKRNVQLNFEQQVVQEQLLEQQNGINNNNRLNAADIENGIQHQQQQGDLVVALSTLNVVGDDMRIRQIILNIVSNALKFVEEGNGKINVTASYVPDGLPGNRPLITNKDGLKNDEPEPISYPRRGAIKISVTDNGAGMSEQQLKLLFREGVQFDANKMQAGGGSGLGLYITKGLIEQHGGNISVESEGQGHGTTFTIYLPLYECRHYSEQTTASHHFSIDDNNLASSNGGTDTTTTNKALESGGGAEAADVTPTTNNNAVSSTKRMEQNNLTRHRRVLVVDDAAMNRKMLIRLLERAGHSCNSAANGQEAVDAILADQEQCRKTTTTTDDDSFVPYDTILMDFEMPILNGPDATSIIRSHGCNAFIVGVTGNVLLEDVNHFKSKGADLVLAKPLKVTALEEAWMTKAGRQRAKSVVYSIIDKRPAAS